MLKNEPDITEVSYNAWISTIKPFSLNQNKLTLVVPTDMNLGIIKRKYMMYIESAVRLSSPHREYEIEVITKSEAEKSSSSNIYSPSTQGIMFNPCYTFETFVIGQSNNFAHAASLAVAEAPAKETNPLFLYGGTGLGKTHLLHAIGNYILSQTPDKKVIYVSSEKFINDLINAIKNRKTDEFRYKYRNIDVLMIDDIQFIAGKESTQEEIFHTFNDLYSSNKQIIISSDKSPKDIPTLEERLRSRFEWGLIADIQPPDFETRTAILRKKLEFEGISVSDDVIEFISSKIDANIRELEGSLKRILMYSTITGRNIDLELAQDALKDFFTTREKKVNAKSIMEIVARFYNLKPEDFIAKRRDNPVAQARQTAMYLCRELTDLSLPSIGEEFGGRDHSTVIHAINKVNMKSKTDPAFKTELNNLKKRIQGL
ncbi:MAG TPA: chromosomal replication initiator protein DnaA [Clostridia bacterium]|nr:chromosomal replication initiator protein DnaA [Clostridia bacterium]